MIIDAISGVGGGSDLSDYAKQEELSNLVLTGTTNTSGATIAAGTCFVLNGDFVTAKTAIASGATFTLNTNYEKKSVGSILSELNSNKQDKTDNSLTTTAKTVVGAINELRSKSWRNVTSAEGVSCNDFPPQSYAYTYSTTTDCPTGPSTTQGWLILTYGIALNIKAQIAIYRTGSYFAYRGCYDGTWGTWKNITAS